jgi:hypothetical protein
MQLRSLLEKFNPGLDIDAEIAAFGSSSDVVQDSPDGVEDGAAREDYEWNEASSHVSPGSSAMHKDGMAILPSLNAGYLGKLLPSRIRLKLILFASRPKLRVRDPSRGYGLTPAIHDSITQWQ